MAPPYTVAVLGAGPQGLAALKNILEESDGGALFQPTLFEARDGIGGLWAYSDDPETTTVLQSTLGNVCRYRNCYADFPVQDEDGDWDDTGVYQGQRGFLRYLERYTESFELKKWIRFRCRATRLRRLEEQGKWELTIQDERKGGLEENILFDKVIVATGQYCVPLVPTVAGLELFKGAVMHSKRFKKTEDFPGKKVLVFGFGNTAADIATELAECADKVFLSHRNGNYIFPRINQGRPMDSFSNRRKNEIKDAIIALAPVRSQGMLDSVVEKMSSSAFTLRPEWRFLPAPPLALSSPIISDNLVDSLARGSVTSVAGLRRVVGERAVELDDGEKLEVDCIIFCTGYHADFSLMTGVEFEKQKQPPPESQDALPDPRIPRLYQNIFAPDFAESLAFLNNWKLGTGICEVADLMSMAIAQIWKGAYQLPSVERMNREIDAHREWCLAVTGGQGGSPKLVNEGKWRAWMHEAAGTGVNEMLGYGWYGWWFWFQDSTFCTLLMSGVESPHLARLFDGRRKKWDGARATIFRDNKDLETRFGNNSGSKKTS